jgi:pyruvate/2-oxoglutarate dehydrogenase complex dihydrolipoamide dehydrogenase (E3) component
MTEDAFDVVIVGAGQAGKPLALDLGKAGRRTALVERSHVGGTCINVGCTPTKTMVASARVAYLARRGEAFGVRTAPVIVEMARVRERKRAIVASFRKGIQRKLERASQVSLIFGEARLLGPHQVEVALGEGGTRRLSAETIVINTGARPSVPRLPGLDGVASLDSTTVMELDRVPDHLIVLGGGYVGVEFAQMFRRFGAQVTLVQREPHLLPREDEDVAGEVAKILAEDGVALRLEAEAVRVAKRSGGVALTVRGPKGEEDLSASHLLVAVGRTPNTDGLGLDVAGVTTDERGYVKVNERLETGVPGILAAGDVTGGPAFTHISYDDYRVLRDRLLHGKDASTRGRLVPRTVFMDPELAHVGQTEREAREADRPVKVIKMPMTHVARALEMDEPRGFLKAMIDPESRHILGFTAIGVGGGELMAVVETAILGKLPCDVLRDAIFVHPTMAESLNNLFALVD